MSNQLHRAIGDLIHDPDFNPTAWLYDALELYVGNNLVKIIMADEVARKHLIPSMEEGYVSRLVSGLKGQEPDDLVQLLDQRIRRMSGFSNYSRNYTLDQILRNARS